MDKDGDVKVAILKQTFMISFIVWDSIKFIYGVYDTFNSTFQSKNIY